MEPAKSLLEFQRELITGFYEQISFLWDNTYRLLLMSDAFPDVHAGILFRAYYNYNP